MKLVYTYQCVHPAVTLDDLNNVYYEACRQFDKMVPGGFDLRHTRVAIHEWLLDDHPTVTVTLKHGE